MKSKSSFNDVDFDGIAQDVEEALLSDEVERKFAAYTFYTIGDRALADVVDGLKPVQRRILFSMFKSGLTPNKTHTKSARVVGNTMGNYHPHGDASIYDALVRLAQTHTYPAPLIDPQGNFGAPGISAAASRYTECRLSAFGMLLTEELKDKVVEMVPNFDDSLEEPLVLPAQIPALLINGTSGIAVAMASSMAPHNPIEAMNVCLFQLRNQDKWKAVEDADGPQQEKLLRKFVQVLMKKMPGPDFPTGGKILGIEGAEDAYVTGSGKIIMQSQYSVTPESRGKHKITFTEFPYGVAPSAVIKQLRDNEEKFIKSTQVIKENGGSGKVEGFQIDGILSIDDYAGIENSAQLVVMVDAKTNPQVVVAELFKRTILESSFNFNNNCLVNGTPKVVSLPELVQHFINARRRVVRTRASNEKERKDHRLHIVNGLLKILLDLDKAIKIIRGADSQEVAHTQLMKTFKIDDEQAKYVLDTPLRRLTKYDSVELDEESTEIKSRLEELEKIIVDSEHRDAIVEKEFLAIIHDMKKDDENQRKSEIINGSLEEYVEQQNETLSMSREVVDEELTLYLEEGKVYKSTRKLSDSCTRTSTMGEVIVITNRGRGIRTAVLDIASGKTPKQLEPEEKVVAISNGQHPVLVGTKRGVVFAFAPNYPTRYSEFQVMTLDDDDEILLGKEIIKEEGNEVVFITSDTSLLRFDANKVAVKSTLKGKGMAGIKLGDGAEVISFNMLNVVEKESSIVTTYTGETIKQTPLKDFPSKGRATGGVRAHRLLKGEERLLQASVGVNPVVTIDEEQHNAEYMGKRDGSGIKVNPVESIRTALVPLKN